MIFNGSILFDLSFSDWPEREREKKKVPVMMCLASCLTVLNMLKIMLELFPDIDCEIFSTLHDDHLHGVQTVAIHLFWSGIQLQHGQHPPPAAVKNVKLQVYLKGEWGALSHLD